MKRILASSVCALALLACQDQLSPEPDVPEPEFDISDVHVGGAALNQHFAFRFPIRRLSQRPPAGEAFDGSLRPVMRICRWTGSACDSPESELTLSSGSAIRFDLAGHDVAVRRNGIVVLPDLEAYLSLWDSRTLRPTGNEAIENEVYRLRVLVGATELGYMDAKVWRTLSQLREINQWNEANPGSLYFPLPRNSILPIPFWIGELALAQAQSLELTGLPVSLISGATASVTVTVRDAGGNVASGYRGTVAFTSSDPEAILPPNYTFTAADAGARTFADAISFKQAGTETTVRVTDVAEPGRFAETSLNVLPLDAATLQVSGLSNPSPAGAAGSVTVTARDVNGNIATSYTGTIGFTSSDPLATLPEDYTFTAADAGSHAFEAAVTLRSAGEVTVRAADNADAGTFGEVSVTVGAVAAATLQVTGLNDPTVAGAAGSITLAARDPSGNLAADYTGTIAFTSTDPLATLPESYTFTAEDAGTHSFPNAVTLGTAGSVTVAATDEAFSTITGAQTVTVAPAAAATLVLGGIPAQTTAGVAYDLTVTAKDEFGNTATGYGGTVGFASTDAAAVLPPAYSFQAGDAGVRSFPGGVTFKTAGERTLQATDAAAPAITGSLATTVAPASAAELRFTVQPSDALTGNAIAPPVVVTAYDPFENLASAFTAQVTIGIGTNPGTGTLAGTVQVAAVSGAATFDDLRINAAGTGFTFAASATGLTGAISEPFDIIAPTPVEVHWINAAGGNWSLPSNWSTGTVPTAEQTAIIDLAGTYTVTLDLNTTVNRFSLGATSGTQTLNAVNRTLGIITSGTILSTGRVTLNNAPITGAGPLTNAGIIQATSTQIANPFANQGTFVSVLASSLAGAVTTTPSSLIQVRGTTSTSGVLTVAAGFTNNGKIELTGLAPSIGATLSVVSGTLINAPDATIEAALPTVGPAGRTLNAQLDNRGTITLSTALTISRGAAQHVNNGLIDVKDGNLTLTHASASPTFTNNGTITVAAGRTWAIGSVVGTTGTNRVTMAAGSTLNGGGAITVNSVNVAFQTAFTLSSLSLSNTTTSFATNVTTDAVALTITGATINGPGTLTNAGGKMLTVTNTTINAPLINAGTLETVLSAVINGGFTTLAGSILKVRGTTSTSGTLSVATGFTNQGAIELIGTAGATLSVVSGTLINAVGATIDAEPGAGNGGRTLNAQLDNRGTITVGGPLTIGRGAADHVNSGLIDVSGGNVTLNHASTSPSFTNSGTITVAAGRAWTIVVLTGTTGGSSFTQTTGGTLNGGGTFDVGGFTPFNNSGTVSLEVARIGNALTGTGTFSPATAEFFSNATSIPVGATYSYTNVRVLNSTTFAGSASLAGNLTVAGTGNLTIGGHEITVAGSFATQNTGVLTMLNAAGILTVSGNASFGGGTTNTRLTAGTLRLAGDFAQGGGTAGAFAPTLNHLTVLNGSGPQTVSFANPGTTAALSHFHRLEIQNASAAGVTLGSPVSANGQLRTPAGPSVARTLSSTGHILQVGGLAAVGLVLDRTPLLVVNGEELTRFDGAVFRNMDPAATQFRLDRSADVVTFNSIQFLTAPTTGVYLHLVDTDLVAPLFTLTMQGAQPPSHGGKVIESVAGQLVGWPF